MAKQFLTEAYDLENSAQTKNLYKEWAETYDAEISANGYASPLRTANALVKCGAALDAATLDIGCGTGVSGLFLKRAGFSDIHGSDFSPQMLTLAEEKAIYKKIYHADLNDPFSFIDTPFTTITAIGVLAPGHAQPDIIATVINLLPQGGMFGFSMNDHTLDNPGYESEITRLVKKRCIRIRWYDYGEHLPNINLNSMIVVLEKL